MTWTDERIAQLKAIWGQGLSASDIAQQLGLGRDGRNKVLGKAWRLGLGGKPTKAGIKGRQTLTKAQRRALRKQNAFGLNIDIKPTPATGPTKPAPVRVREDIPLPVARVTWDELDTHHCRWPVGEVNQEGFGFCGQPRVEGLSYCADCAERAKPKPRTEPSQSFVIRHRRWALEPA